MQQPGRLLNEWFRGGLCPPLLPFQALWVGVTQPLLGEWRSILGLLGPDHHNSGALNSVNIFSRLLEVGI